MRTLSQKVFLQYEMKPYPLLLSLIIRQMHGPFFIVAVNKILRLFHRNSAFNILNGSINQIFRWLESVHCLKADRSTPCIALISFIWFRLPQIFPERIFFSISTTSLHNFIIIICESTPLFKLFPMDATFYI